MKVGITLHEIQHLNGGDPSTLISVAKLADAKGIDYIVLGDHLILTKVGAEKYPSKIPVPVEYEQYEPLVTLAAIASATSRIRLSTGIMIGPLRSAILLAKQAATLDKLSGGRLSLGIGAGWQPDEFEASGIPFEGRFGRLEEQVRACKELWTRSPATYHGKTVSFTEAYCNPLPAQNDGIPIWLGLSLSDRNVCRVAEVADGWIATTSRDHRGDFADSVRKLRTAFQSAGRDPSSLEVALTHFPLRRADGSCDLDATLVDAKSYIADGATLLIYQPHLFCKSMDEIDNFLTGICEIKHI